MAPTPGSVKRVRRLRSQPAVLPDEMDDWAADLSAEALGRRRVLR